MCSVVREKCLRSSNYCSLLGIGVAESKTKSEFVAQAWKGHFLHAQYKISPHMPTSTINEIRLLRLSTSRNLKRILHMRSIQVNFAKDTENVRWLPKHPLRNCWICRLEHGPRNKSPKRLARCEAATRCNALRLQPSQLRCECMYCNARCCQGLLSVCLSVCLSGVRLSMSQTRALSQNDRKLCPHLYTTWKTIHLNFLTGRLVDEATPLREIVGQTAPVLSGNAIFNRYSLAEPQPHNT